MLLGWTMLFLILLIVIVWDSSAKWATLARGIKTLARRLDEMEERHTEVQELHRRDQEEMQGSIWRVRCRVAALQHRVEALTARLDIIEEPAPTRANPKVKTAVRAFISSFERDTAR
jgi:phage shock protein A